MGEVLCRGERRQELDTIGTRYPVPLTQQLFSCHAVVVSSPSCCCGLWYAIVERNLEKYASQGSLVVDQVFDQESLQDRRGEVEFVDKNRRNFLLCFEVNTVIVTQQVVPSNQQAGRPPLLRSKHVLCQLLKRTIPSRLLKH